MNLTHREYLKLLSAPRFVIYTILSCLCILAGEGLAQTSSSPKEPPPGAIVLFDGKDTSKLMQHSGMRIPTPGQLASVKPCHYKLVDGTLEVFGGGHVISRQFFQDFRLHVEVYLPDGPSINSGIWIAFRYGVEIGSRDRGPLYQLGSLYGMKAPDKDAMRPPPSWNELDIHFTAPRFDKDGKKTVNAKITVCLNGEKIHDGVELPSTTKTLQEPEAPTPGPIVLENHKTARPVRFRNVWIVPR